MPAYFSISIQFKREDIYTSFVKDFYLALAKAGLEFKSGYRCYENTSYQDITEWNQKLLEKNFELGFTENYIHDYKQVLFHYKDYSEVRGFWLNNYLEDGEFSFEIIIPERDILKTNEKAAFKSEKIKDWIEVGKKVWTFDYVKAIQTELELSDTLTGVSDLEMGVLPSILPFSIVKDKYSHFIDDSLYKIEKIQNGGILIIDASIK